MSIALLQSAATAGNVDTDHVVPSGAQRKVLYGQVTLTTDATVANRRVVLQVLDDTDAVIYDTHAGAVVAASAADQHHEFMQGIFRETSFIGNALQVPIGADMVMIEGWTLRITIENAVAGDSYTSTFVVSDIHENAVIRHFRY